MDVLFFQQKHRRISLIKQSTAHRNFHSASILWATPSISCLNTRIFHAQRCEQCTPRPCYPCAVASHLRIEQESKARAFATSAFFFQAPVFHVRSVVPLVLALKGRCYPRFQDLYSPRKYGDRIQLELSTQQSRG